MGEISLRVSVGHRGALDIYVPLVDWGARFEAIRFPARLHADLRTVDREAAQRIASGEYVNLEKVRTEARDAVASYLKQLIAIVTMAGAALGVLTALAVRGRSSPRARYTAGAAIATALATGLALVFLLPPRGPIADPQYYAHGPDIPRALSALESIQRSSRALDQELDAQLVGLAQLVVAPGNREPLAGRPSAVIAVRPAQQHARAARAREGAPGTAPCSSRAT